MSAFTKAASATGVVGAVAFSVLAGGMSASAAPIDCAALGATTIAPGICQIVVTTSGTFSIGAPVGVTVTHLEALLVAGGTAGGATGGGYDGGYGGEVVYVNNVPLTPLTVTIGAGGTTGGNPASPTVVTDGATQFTEADPAELEDPADPDTGTYDPSINGAPGVLPSAFVATANPASTLFPAYAGEQSLAGDGVDGELVDGTDDPFPLAPSQTPAGGGQPGPSSTARANSGAGGAGNLVDFQSGNFYPAGDGAAGVVIFRFAAPEAPAALAATGVDASTATAAAGVLLLGGAAALIAGRRRRTRS